LAGLVGLGSVLGSPVLHNGIEPRGQGRQKDIVVYTVETVEVIVEEYIITETEYLYEVTCHWNKLKKKCNYKVFPRDFHLMSVIL
jgi:hypothetical protein